MAQNLNHRPRRINLAILVVGTIAAIACAFGPISMVRAGVAVSVLTAVASVVLTWRQMNELVREHLAEVHALRENFVTLGRALALVPAFFLKDAVGTAGIMMLLLALCQIPAALLVCRVVRETPAGDD